MSVSPGKSNLSKDRSSKGNEKKRTANGSRPDSQNKELPPHESIVAELARRELVEFVEYSFRILRPTQQFISTWHIEAICEHLEAILAGEIANLLITVPPKTGKSMICSVMFPAWAWINRPWIRWLYSSHNYRLAVRDSLDCRSIIESAWYQTHWHDRFQLLSDQNEKTRYQNSQKGERMISSLGGGGTGEGGHIVICDDPHDVEKAVYSKTIRERDIEAWDQKFSARLIPGAKIRARIIVMQRCHPLDLAGHVLSQGGYVHLDLPMEYREGRTVTAWYADPRKTSDELLCPALHDAAAVADLKVRTRSSGGYAAQYLQEPRSPKGEAIKRSWLMRWGVLPADMDEWLQSWDMTFKEGGSSRVSGTVWTRKGSTKYLVDRVNGDMNFSATLQAVRDLSAKWPQARTKIVEEAANGYAVIDTLQKEISGLIGWPPKAVKGESNWAYQVARSSKAARMNACVPEFEARNVLLPDSETNPWVHDYVEELCGWPNAAFDDDVDSTTQALLRFASEEVRDAEAFPISVGGGKSYWKRVG